MSRILDELSSGASSQKAVLRFLDARPFHERRASGKYEGMNFFIWVIDLCIPKQSPESEVHVTQVQTVVLLHAACLLNKLVGF